MPSASAQINTMYTQLNQYHVILEADPSFQTDPEMLNKIYIQAKHPRARRARARDLFRRFSIGFGGLECDHGAGALHALLRDFHAACERAGFGGHFEHSPNFTTSSTPSNAVPLSAFAHLVQGPNRSPSSIRGNFLSVTVSFNLAPNASLGSAITAIDKVADESPFSAQRAIGLPGHGGRFQKLAVQSKRC